MSFPPIAFLSYVRFNDEHDDGRVSELCQRLSGEVRVQTGATFEIFQDRKDIRWGQEWQKRLDGAIDASTFLIPILTPGFFKSKACREELERFLEREKQLGRSDLVLPIYYVESAVFSQEEKRRGDALAQVLATRQYADWRELRFEPLTTPQVRRAFASLAKRVADALEGDPVPQSASAPSARLSGEGAPGQGVHEPPRGPSPKTEPPTLIVDAMHRGDHATISAALEAAPPGARILVRPGLYREGLVIDKPVEILGDGERSEIVVETTGADCILFQTSMGRVANLTLRQRGGGEWFAVDISQGRLDLENCDISSQSLACVAIHDGADPRLRRNRIYAGKQGGVFVLSSGQGLLEENEIFGNALTGVEIKEGGSPTLRRNRISQNGYEGIWVYGGGGGTFEENDLRDNIGGAWDIAADCEPLVKRKDNLE